VILGAIASALGLSGRHEEARGVIARLEDLRAHLFSPATALALAYLGVGERDAAIRWLRAGIDGHEASVAFLGVHPAYDSLRDHPDYHGLLRRLGLAAEAAR
jgi:hypothetical protein